MRPDKILFVDDEAMALKYFERLVSPLAPVITASSVELGKAVLRERGGEIAVLVSDQRMPGAHGNELLGYAREYHPNIVRMLTTAYSELGQAIEAINSGEIYRYITKPWELESLHADLRNALELAELRNQRDFLVREKLMVQQQQVLGSRLATIALLGATCAPDTGPVYRYAQVALLAGCPAPASTLMQLDFAGLLQAETRRSVAIASGIKAWMAEFGDDRSPERAFSLLGQALNARVQGASVTLSSSEPLTNLLVAGSDQLPGRIDTAWLAWLLWLNAPVLVQASEGGWSVRLSDSAEAAVPADWLERMIEQLLER
jgi:two-component system probable response regulator PhcQ